MRTQQMLKLSVAVSMSFVLAIGAASPSAASTINWLNMAPTPFGSVVPNNSVFNLPGVGNVTVTYSIPTALVNDRGQNPLLLNGNVGTYSWTAQELLGVTSFAPNPPFVTTPWSVTYTFPGTVAPGTLFAGVAGLGKTSSFGGGASTATVNQNGAFLGDWTGGGNYGATQFIPGAGTFSMQNSVTGLGGADPWWNSALGVVQILDPVNSLTFFVNQLPGDGLGVNIGSVVPEPASLALLGLGGLALLRRRKAVV
jgi:hypothetical protein